ncbi:MAG: biopolymer transporter ExbD [Phycisphaerae bacterium]|nr:biopolymer transporter ExbD [Phycisphaerae bacterium]
MRLRKTRRTYGTEINIAALIDVVFLLIIFFMTVSQFTRVEAEPLALPEAQQGRQDDSAMGRMIVNLHADGRIVVAGRTCSDEQLQALLVREKSAAGPDGPAVLIRGDRDALWRSVSTVMRLCAAENIQKVRVSVVDSPDTRIEN